MENEICPTADTTPSSEETEPPGQLFHHSPVSGADLVRRSTPFPASLFSKSIRTVKPQGLKTGSRFPIGARARAFRAQFFSNVLDSEWNDWHWQLRNRIRSEASLSQIVSLSESERTALADAEHALPLAITPYYASLLSADDPNQPIRRTVVPVAAEHQWSSGEDADPLHEEADSPVPGIVHRYPDRVLFLTTDFCSTYCRYCTRSRMVGRSAEQVSLLERWSAGIEYIERTPTVRDVLLSGGDPLTLSNDQLEWLLARLRRIPHVELIRIGTKVPVVLPQRVTLALTRMLRHYHPLWMSIHVTHPDELTEEMRCACARLAEAGIPLGSQTVLLSGINDDATTMRSLVHGLLTSRVKPYYLYQCDPIPGSAHFRTSVRQGLELIGALRGHTTGYAVPTYVIDAPGGGGKIPLLPESVVGREGDALVLRNYEGKLFRYPDRAGERTGLAPQPAAFCAEGGLER